VRTKALVVREIFKSIGQSRTLRWLLQQRKDSQRLRGSNGGMRA